MKLNQFDTLSCSGTAGTLSKMMVKDCPHLETGACERCIYERLEVFLRRLVWDLRQAGVGGQVIKS